jgi:hypothetical protein
MKRGLGARAESFLLLLRGDTHRHNHGQDDTDQSDAGKPERDNNDHRVEKDRRKKLGAFRSLPLFRASFLRAGDKTVAADQGRAVERRPSLPYESDDDDSSYAEDFNHDSGRVNSRSRRRRRRTTSKRTKQVHDESDSESAARGASSHEDEVADSDESATSSNGSEDESSEECVIVHSSDESEEEDSDESSYEEEEDSDNETSGEEEGKLERAQLRREARLLRKEKQRREREREKMKTAEEKRRQKVEKRKLRKVEEQRKREGLEELQRQIRKLRAERELKRQEEKDLKELRRIDRLLAKERQKEEKKARKLQEKEQRHREKILKQKQVRELILARLGRSAEDVTQKTADSISRETRVPTTEAIREASSASLPHDEQEIEFGRQVDTDIEQADNLAKASDACDDQVKTVGFSIPSIKGLPSRGGPAKEVLIAVTERRPSIAPSKPDAEPAEEETEEAEDEDEGDVAGGRRAVNNRGRVTDIPALRITGKTPVAAKRSPASKLPHASSAQLIRGLIGFDELEDALFELNRQVEELRSLTS